MNATQTASLSADQALKRLERKTEEFCLSVARTHQDVHETLTELHLCLAKFPPEQSQVAEAIALLASALARTLSAPDLAPAEPSEGLAGRAIQDDEK